MHAIEELGKPPALTLDNLKLSAEPALVQWLDDRRNWRAIPHRLEECGYVRVQNRYSQQGLWRVNNKRQAIYARDDLSAAARLKAACMKRTCPPCAPPCLNNTPCAPAPSMVTSTITTNERP